MKHWEGCPADEPRIDAFGAYCGVCGASNTRATSASLRVEKNGTGSRANDSPAPTEATCMEVVRMIGHSTPKVNPATAVE